MPTGIAGDSIGATIAGIPADELNLVELRVISNLLQSLLGSNQAIDELRILRNDQATELTIPTPIPGN